MMWQMFTAFGIMVGFAMDLAFLHVADTPHVRGLNWRLMLASVSLTNSLFILKFKIYLVTRLVSPLSSS